MVMRTLLNTTMVDQVGSLSSSHEELVRAVGQGVSALRDSSDNVLEMNPDELYPALGSFLMGVTCQWSPNTFQVRDHTQQHWRDLSARNISCQEGGGITCDTGHPTYDTHMYPGEISAPGGIITTGLGFSGTVNSDFLFIGGDAHVGNNLDVSQKVTTQNVFATTLLGNVRGTNAQYTDYCDATNSMTTFEFFCQTVHADGNIASLGEIYAQIGVTGGIFVQAPTLYGTLSGSSDSRVKRDIVPVSDDDLDVMLAAPVKRWRRLPSPDLTGEAPAPQVGPMAEDLPEVAQRPGPPGPDGEPDGVMHYDMQTYVGLLHGLIQRMSSKIDDLTSRVAALEGAA